MADIAVVHNKFETRGGAEVVCMHTIDALQNAGHDISLYSFDEPDFKMLNKFCGTDVDPVPVWTPKRVGPGVNNSIVYLQDLTDGRIGPHIKLKTAILSRLIFSKLEGYDLSISTSSEIALPRNGVQYIHFPRFNNRYQQSPWGANGLKETVYDTLCTRLGMIDTNTIQRSKLITNSKWTADIIYTRYGIRPSVIPPPVLTDQFSDVPWNNREFGFVSIGRIAPDKRILRVIRIIDQLRNLGHDVHIHIIGPNAKHNHQYFNRIKNEVEKRNYVFLEGEVSRSKLAEIVSSHKYGIHGKPNEHFGIGIAELIAGGTIPFVPDSGGQVELVNDIAQLMYSSEQNGVGKIDTVLSNEELGLNLRGRLPSVSKEFNQSQFRTGFRRVVEKQLERANIDEKDLT